MTKMNEFIVPKKDKINSSALKINTAEEDSEDEIQLSLGPYVQTCLAHSNSRGGCGCLPVPFERAAPHSWIRPCFDSDILENQFKINSFKQFTKRFRYALIYMMTVSAAWLIFLISQPYPETIIFEYVIFAQMFLVAMWIFHISRKEVYQVHNSIIAAATALHLVFTSLIFTIAGGTEMVSHFTMVCCIILVIYTIIPLQPYISLIICICFTIAFETIILTTQKHFIIHYYGFIIRIMCHICVHIVGFHILVMTHVRVRGTFMKVGQRLLVRKQLEMEKQLKEKMIHSVMPPKVADWLLSAENGDSLRPTNQQDLGSLFRPFNMYRMDNVSILFADIVGFTKMSSNKTAEQIVDILNDLFERFDDLCLTNGCEKISTLGDCYYCVSGCPEPQQDHARCCVEMGLDMIDAIHKFDEERGEDVNMRVGVHTGTVLCGIVGSRRFKFDVWSNDVTFANKLESTGLPGRVHISEQTARFLSGMYALESYEDLQGVKTYLIKARAPICRNKSESHPMESQIESTNNGIVNLTTSRKSISYNQNPMKRSHYLSLLTEARTKFASLPNVLGSHNTLAEPSEKINSSNRFSFSKLKKNSTHEISSSLKHFGKDSSGNFVSSRSSFCKLEVPKRESQRIEEEVSLCQSLNSRKDSIIRSNGRRNSIQQQIYIMNGINQGEVLAKRVSGYYTSSQSTLSPIESESENERIQTTPDNLDELSKCFYSLRKQSDLELIRCVNDITQNSYIVKVPLDQFTLFFKDKKTEKEYRANAHKIHEKKGDSPPTLSTSRFNTYFDILISAMVLICSTVSLYVLYEPEAHFIAASVVALLVESVALSLCLIHLIKTRKNRFNETTQFFSKKIFYLFSKWYPWHAFGGILVSLPILVVLANFTCHYTTCEDMPAYQNFTFAFLNSDENKKIIMNVELQDEYYTILILIGLVHFCNFNQLNFFLKSTLATFAGIIYLVLIHRENCQYYNKNYISTIFVSQFLSKNIFVNETKGFDREIYLCCQQFRNIFDQLSLGFFDAKNYYNLGIQFLELYYSRNSIDADVYYATESGFEFFVALNQSLTGLAKDTWLRLILSNISDQVLPRYNSSETILNVLVILFLVILLNREFEISYRLSYYCNTESRKDKTRVQNMKNQADWLLENIIPKHVSIELKNRAKYCKNHSNVGIIFASIVNFNKLYEETYSGGKEYLRVLNELISDFDELLNLEKFKNVDKIKTIGSTFMGASGLNAELRKENNNENDHIFELMNFALEMYRVVHFFNRDLLGFNLILRVGFNIGEVTAGVIGSSKLFYDIWGDAVNVASRMDSCGVDGRIQVPYSCLDILSGRYNFEPRGSVYVKGKGDILVYLVKEPFPS